jgi:hypothetical protein
MKYLKVKAKNLRLLANSKEAMNWNIMGTSKEAILLDRENDDLFKTKQFQEDDSGRMTSYFPIVNEETAKVFIESCISRGFNNIPEIIDGTNDISTTKTLSKEYKASKEIERKAL